MSEDRTMPEPFYLEPGETVLWARRLPTGYVELRVRTAEGVEAMHHVYPGEPVPAEIAALLPPR